MGQGNSRCKVTERGVGQSKAGKSWKPRLTHTSREATREELVEGLQQNKARQAWDGHVVGRELLEGGSKVFLSICEQGWQVAVKSPPPTYRRRVWLTASLPSLSMGCNYCTSSETTSLPPTARLSTVWSCY